MNAEDLYRLDHLQREIGRCEARRNHHDFLTYQIIDFLIVCEERFSFSILVLNESLDVQVETLSGRTLIGLCGQLALFKQECQQGE